MSAAEKKSKRNGFIGTIIFHALLLIAFLFLGLTYQDPPPAEEGISINFGFTEQGSGEVSPENNAEIPEVVEQEKIEQQVENIEEIITQTTEEAPTTKAVEKPKKTTKKKEVEEEVIEEEKPKVNRRALYPGKKKNSKTSEGNKGGNGNQGAIDGDPNAKVYEGGGIGENGSAYQLGGRSVSFKAKPTYNMQVEGKVVVLITVDRLGNVINAIPGAKGSTTLNKQLLERAKTAALKTKFSPKTSAPTNQQGKIIYHFQLN